MDLLAVFLLTANSIVLHLTNSVPSWHPLLLTYQSSHRLSLTFTADFFTHLNPTASGGDCAYIHIRMGTPSLVNVFVRCTTCSRIIFFGNFFVKTGDTVAVAWVARIRHQPVTNVITTARSPHTPRRPSALHRMQTLVSVRGEQAVATKAQDTAQGLTTPDFRCPPCGMHQHTLCNNSARPA